MQSQIIMSVSRYYNTGMNGSKESTSSIAFHADYSLQ
jgi:hypothetical protein